MTYLSPDKLKLWEDEMKIAEKNRIAVELLSTWLKEIPDICLSAIQFVDDMRKDWIIGEMLEKMPNAFALNYAYRRQIMGTILEWAVLAYGHDVFQWVTTNELVCRWLRQHWEQEQNYWFALAEEVAAPRGGAGGTGENVGDGSSGQGTPTKEA